MQIDFPIIADPTREISVKYGMLDSNIKVPSLREMSSNQTLFRLLTARGGWFYLERHAGV